MKFESVKLNWHSIDIVVCYSAQSITMQNELNFKKMSCKKLTLENKPAPSSKNVNCHGLIAANYDEKLCWTFE